MKTQTDDRAAKTLPIASIDDAAKKVEEALNNHPILRAFDLDANDRGTGIVLTGRVPIRFG